MSALGPVLLALPWLSGAAVAARSAGTRQARRVAIGAASLGLIIAAALLLLGVLQPTPGSRWVTVGMPAVVALIGLVAAAMSPSAGCSPGTIARTQLVSAASVALVAAAHPIAIAVLWACTALPAFAELRARQHTHYAARVFAVYQLPSVLLVATGVALQLEGQTALAVFPLAIGFALREAVVPAHSWFVVFVTRAPLGMVVAFAASQVGVHAHLVLLAEGLPKTFEVLVATLGAATAVYAAALGVVQSGTRRALGYLIMSQTALVAFGLDTHSEVAHAGTLLAWMVTALATAGFAMAIAALEARRGLLALDRPNGNFTRVPRLAAAFLVTGLASVGLPGTLGFVAEDLLVQGSVDEFPLLAFALIVATALNGMTVMRNFFLLFNGSARHQGEQDLTLREALALSLLMVVLVGAGLAPRLLTSTRSLERAHAGSTAFQDHNLAGPWVGPRLP